MWSHAGPFHRFFNDPVIQELLHVRGHNLPGLNFRPETKAATGGSDGNGNGDSGYYAPAGWEVCNDDINSQLKGNHHASCVPSIDFLIKHIRVLLYSGENDLNTNFLGTLHVLETHSWAGKRWTGATRALWKFGEEVAGEYFKLDQTKLSFLIVRNSGHLLPMDLPAQALDMISRFVRDQSLADVPLRSELDYLMDFELQRASLLEAANDGITASIVWLGVGLFIILAVASIALRQMIVNKGDGAGAILRFPSMSRSDFGSQYVSIDSVTTDGVTATRQVPLEIHSSYHQSGTV
jgi:Serine carboxypeptidase